MSSDRSRNAVGVNAAASLLSRRAGQLRLAVAKCGSDSDNRCMAKYSRRDDETSAAHAPVSDPFSPGSMVVVTLGNPHDKFWGVILALAPEGLSISGIELSSFEDFVVMVKDGEPFSPAVVFFPMHRIERVELDLPDGNLSSLSQRFSAKTARDPAELLGSAVAEGRKLDTAASRRAVRPNEDPA